MCKSTYLQAFMPEAKLKQRAYESSFAKRLAMWQYDKTGYVGNMSELEGRLTAKASGGEWVGDTTNLAVQAERQEAERLSKTYHGQSTHSQNVARKKAGPTVVPIAGRGGAL